MKIVHICLACFFSDGYTYQENMLPKFHKALGHDVEVIASLVTFDQNGKQTLYSGPMQYRNEYDIPVTRLNYRQPSQVFSRFRRFKGFRDALARSAPDVIFVHGCQFMDIDVVADYAKRHSHVQVYVDNHADFSNSAQNWVSRRILHGVFWRLCARRIAPFTRKFYGVLPARVDFLRAVYGLLPGQCELLVMGADDDLVARAKKPDARVRIRERYHIAPDDFLIVTGGKINRYRPEVLDLMAAVESIERSSVRLLVFGKASEEYQERFEALCRNDRIDYVGWLPSAETYAYFAAADLVVFPGLHSVMWEQAVAQGKPCLFRDLEGFHHVDMGGNAMFLRDVSAERLRAAILQLSDDPTRLAAMRRAAEAASGFFSYREIAERCLQ